MQGFVRKGLLLSVATGALVLGGGAAAMADTAGARGSATDSPGALSGNVAQAAGDNPINVCGDTGNVASVDDAAKADQCTTAGNSAAITGAAQDSPGVASGNVAGAALDAPVQVCGVAAHALSTGSGTNGNTCSDTGESATATGVASDSPGVGSGNVIQLTENAPVDVCGDSLGVGSFGSPATGNACLNVGVPTTPAPVPVSPPPPVVTPPPAVTPPPVVAPPAGPPVCTASPTPPAVTPPVPPVVTPPVPPVVTPPTVPVLPPPVTTPPVTTPPVTTPAPVCGAVAPTATAAPTAASAGVRHAMGLNPLLGTLTRL